MCINEAFESSVGTQRSDLGAYKKFALNLVTVALPNLISHDIVIVHPMTSYSGYINYVEYVAGSNKGSIKQGDLFNSPFGLGNVDPDYTGARVVEVLTAGQTKVVWTPVIPETFKAFASDGTEVEGVTVAKDGTIDFGGATNVVKVAYVYDNQIVPQNDLPTIKAQMKTMPLVAKARHIAIYFSQFAAFQA